MFEIIDNFLTDDCLKTLQDYFLTPQCEWHYNPKLTGDESYNNLGSFGFTIRLHWNQSFVDTLAGNLSTQLVFTTLRQVNKFTDKTYEIVRVRGDMTMFNPSIHQHELHTDFSYEHMTAIFYVNTSDGNTLLYDREGKKLLVEVEPVENRVLIFDGLLQHTGHSPSKHKSRVLINMNFMTKELVEELNNKHKNHDF
jgi:hypothetical protein